MLPRKRRKEKSLWHTLNTVKQLSLEQGADISTAQNALDSAAGQENNQGGNSREGAQQATVTRCRTGERILGSFIFSHDD
jgi:hypothetical protein